MKQQPSITMNPCESSQIESFGHCPLTNTLAIKFKHGGTTYHYSGVTAEKHETMKKSKSVGSFLGAEIRGKHDFKKIEKKKAGEK